MGKFNEPWEIDSEDDYFTDGPHIKNANGFGIAGIWKSGRFGENAEIARRILACVNACEGISTEDLEKGAIEALVAERDALLEMHGTQAQTIVSLRDAMKTIEPYVRDKVVTGRKPLKNGIYTIHIGQVVRDALADSQGEQQ